MKYIKFLAGELPRFEGIISVGMYHTSESTDVVICNLSNGASIHLEGDKIVQKFNKAFEDSSEVLDLFGKFGNGVTWTYFDSESKALISNRE